MGINAKEAKRLTKENKWRVTPPPPELSLREKIGQQIQVDIESVSQKIEEASRGGIKGCIHYLSPMPNELFSDGCGYYFHKWPKTFWGNTKCPPDFHTNAAYLNEINRAVFEHFAGLGFSVTIDWIRLIGESDARMGFHIRWD